MQHIPPTIVDAVLLLTLTLPVPLFALLGALHQRAQARREIKRLAVHLKLYRGKR